MHLSTPLDDMKLADRRDARTFSRAMLLQGGPVSAEGTAFVAEIVDQVVSPRQAARGQLRPSTVEKYRQATGAFLADLLFAARAGRWSKRETNTNALTDLPGGATAFKTMREAMGAAGLLEELPGYRKVPQLRFGKEYTQAARTCFRPTEMLLGMAETHGVPLRSWAAHFTLGELQVPLPAQVVEARGEVKDGERPRRLEVDLAAPKAAAIVASMARLNAHLLVPGRIDGIAFAGLRRLFLKADRPDFDWQRHGRFYSMPPGDEYERMEGGVSARASVVRIDGSEVTEVDIGASHLTVLHGLLGLSFDHARDPYGIEGTDREAVKEWLLWALGRSDPTAGGPKHSRTRAAMLGRYPFLGDLPALGIGPLDLQYHESEIVRLAMETLMDRGVGFLPVHDALMVARVNQGMAQDALRDAFRAYFVDVLGLSAAPVPRLSVAL